MKQGSQQLVRTPREQLAVTSPSVTHEWFLLPSDRHLVLHLQDLFHRIVLLRATSRARKNPDGVKAIEAGAPTVCMHVVSGSISLPSRGSFRLSLTVLVHYRSITSI